MQLFTSLNDLAPHCAHGVALTIGVFDGVHRGHQMLLRKARDKAAELGVPSLVITFRQHPLALLAPPYAPAALTTADEKAALIAHYGADLCWMVDFDTDFATTSADDFLNRVLAGTLNARHVVCGPDFRFGHDGAGGTELLQSAAPGLGFSVEVCEPLLDDHTPIRSSVVRAAVLEGEIERASRLLGHAYALPGTVVQGDQRGRTIGFPTANLQPLENRLVPGDGVYAVRVNLHATPADEHFGAMMNIGKRPTFAGIRRTIEAHIFDFHDDIYGQTLTVTFVSKIRNEMKFTGADELVAQLHRDEEACRSLLSAY